MDNHYRCLTCYTDLTAEEYEQHQREGHTVIEWTTSND